MQSRARAPFAQFLPSKDLTECTERLQEGVELIALAKVNLGLKAGFWSVESALGGPFMIHFHMTSTQNVKVPQNIRGQENKLFFST